MIRDVYDSFVPFVLVLVCVGSAGMVVAGGGLMMYDIGNDFSEYGENVTVSVSDVGFDEDMGFVRYDDLSGDEQEMVDEVFENRGEVVIDGDGEVDGSEWEGEVMVVGVDGVEDGVVLRGEREEVGERDVFVGEVMVLVIGGILLFLPSYLFMRERGVEIRGLSE